VANHSSIKIKKGKDYIALHILAYVVLTVIALLCLLPFLMVFSGSFTDEAVIAESGFSLIPKKFSLEAYKMVFEQPKVILRAYLNTICITAVGTVLGLLFQTMTAYVLCRKDFAWRNFFSFFFYFTTLFSGGLVPTYILINRTLHMHDSYLALLVPMLFSVFNLLIMKSYITAIPEALTDAARIDGCGEFKTLFKIIMPMIKPALATVGLFIALGYWNDWYHSMLYITTPEKYSLQYFLYQQVNNIEEYKRLISMNMVDASVINSISLPTNSLKMALTVVVTGPIILAFPFVHKYFVQGITIGAVKG